MRRRVLALTLLFFSAVPASAVADWIVSPYIGVRFAADTTLFPVGFVGTQRTESTFGSSFGLLTRGVLGVEADVAIVPGFFERRGTLVSKSRVTTVMGNVIAAVPLARSQYGLRPYAIGGVGYIRARAAGANVEELINLDVVGMNVGGGAIGPLTERTSARFDLRYFRNLGGDEEATTAPGTSLELSFWRASLGLTFRF